MIRIPKFKSLKTILLPNGNTLHITKDKVKARIGAKNIKVY